MKGLQEDQQGRSNQFILGGNCIMRIEIQYIKDFLEIVLALDQPDFHFEHGKIRPLWDNLEKRNKFVFHMEILVPMPNIHRYSLVVSA